MTISYEKLCKGGYKRERGETWTCPKCSNVNINQTINPRSGKVQKCSKCGTSKPMVFGVRVCESCKTSDEVYVLPAYVHICPNCSSIELTRFYPITDEALKAGIHPRYSSLKWRCNCGYENPYPYANCLRCGMSIDRTLNETSADEEKAEDVAKKMRLSNWICPYCKRTNKGTDKICPGCGNSGKKPEDDFLRIIHPQYYQDEVSNLSQDNSRRDDQEVKQESVQEVPERKKMEIYPGILEKGKKFLAGMTSIAKKMWWALPILFIILLIMSNYKEEEFVIEDIKYDINYVIEKYTTIHYYNESSYPDDAYNIIETQKSRYVPDEDDDDNNIWNSSNNNNNNGGSNWSSGWDSDDYNWGSDWGSDNDWSSDWDSDWSSGNDWGSDWGSDWNDYGGDYFDNLIHIIQRFLTNTKKFLARIEYYTVYEYDVDRWVYSRTIKYSREKEEINSPEPQFELAANERIASKSTKYYIYLKKSDKLYYLETPKEEWQKYQVGDTIRVKTLFGHPQFTIKN